MQKEISSIIKRYASRILRKDEKIYGLFLKAFRKSNTGACPICEKSSVFVKESDWLRDNYRCFRCRSIPRQRAIILAIERFFPKWRELAIHESSPGGVSSDFIERNCSGYSGSHFYQDVPRGTYKGKFRSEDLSNLTFDDNTFDLIITQDVFEHVLEPEKAFKEIARVLKPGGAHIFTMPWYLKLLQSRIRASLNEQGEIVHLEPPQYHGNPIDNSGSLVTVDWGLDFIDFIYKSSGMTTTTYLHNDPKFGLEAEFLEVFISRKPNLFNA
ncbi:MAG: class I SAM-dependent methyltransferase [Saprospiraceae bacterium]